MARNDPQINFRIPQALREELAQAAEDSGRSLTAELVHRLERSFSPLQDHLLVLEYDGDSDLTLGKMDALVRKMAEVYDKSARMQIVLRDRRRGYVDSTTGQPIERYDETPAAHIISADEQTPPKPKDPPQRKKRARG